MDMLITFPARAVSKNYRELSRLLRVFTMRVTVKPLQPAVHVMRSLACGLLLPDPPTERLNEFCEVSYGDYRA
jgi:hypothetical protein